jgi:hypothetical protein
MKNCYLIYGREIRLAVERFAPLTGVGMMNVPRTEEPGMARLSESRCPFKRKSLIN